MSHRVHKNRGLCTRAQIDVYLHNLKYEQNSTTLLSPYQWNVSNDGVLSTFQTQDCGVGVRRKDRE